MFLAPVAAGYIADDQGWPWIFWWSAIFVAVNLLLFIFAFEETKFSIHTIAGSGIRTSVTARGTETVNASDSSKRTNPASHGQPKDVSETLTEPYEAGFGIDDSIPLKSYRQRMALFTTTAGPPGQFMQNIYRPLQVVVTIPAVTYVMVQYSSALVWFAVVATTQSEYLALPPYNFGTTGIGLLNLPPFIGSVLGCVWGGPVSDWSIKFFARRNEGVYEPEMRLYISLVPGVVGPAGLFLYGYSVSKVFISIS